jgi:DNA-directed RNA polymerase specialized sigma24 family protein
MATRSGGWWAIRVPEIDGLFTQARRLDQVPAMVIDAAALLGVAVDDVTVVADLDIPVVSEAIEARRVADAAAAEASSAMRQAVARLRAEGLTVRDVGALLGVSSQRVSQLVD